ncbi:ABC transporter ATP-binding protein [Haladaptatus salinisoli]|uniref:ABC transporter ATP-binding protein n=1 Tax=Haladaptatus salinisoli TaxID=2884876 RepID=UPI001D0B18D4|nr:phosphate ABC transporter ATP-binding protein [Haladaptatus salinisoli]
MTLAAASVSHGFDGERVLSDVSLSVGPGEVVTVVGPSGTGKTTLLRLLALFRSPEAGAVRWRGEDVWELPDDDRLAVRRRVSMVFQEPSLFNAPVERNVTYGLRVRRPWSERLRSAAARLVGRRDAAAPTEVLETVDLVGKDDQNALSLSGGEAQRVAFARALATDPAVLLLDEPSSNLDPRNTALIEDAVADAAEQGVGVVVATHDMHQAERISDRVAVLLDGTIIETGPPEQVFETPEDDRTRKFVAGELMY